MNNDINDKTVLWAILLTSLMLNVYLLTREDKITEKEIVEYVEKKDTIVSIKKEFDTVYVNKLNISLRLSTIPFISEILVMNIDLITAIMTSMLMRLS